MFLIALPVAGWWLVAAVALASATAPHPREIRSLDRVGASPVEEVDVRARDGVRTRAWWVAAPGDGARRAVVLCAGIRGDRENMLDRAGFYLERGWSALLVDLRGTGESEPARVTMGWHEALDLLAWRGWLDRRGVTRVGVHGQSLGAAAAAFTAVRRRDEPGWQFVVLEACYATLEEAAAARSRGLPAIAYRPVFWLAELWLDLDVQRLDAVAALRAQPAPTLLVGGERDDMVGPDALRRLFEASAAAHKTLCEVPDVAHWNLWTTGADRFRPALTTFLRHLD